MSPRNVALAGKRETGLDELPWRCARPRDVCEGAQQGQVSVAVTPPEECGHGCSGRELRGRRNRKGALEMLRACGDKGNREEQGH